MRPPILLTFLYCSMLFILHLNINNVFNKVRLSGWKINHLCTDKSNHRHVYEVSFVSAGLFVHLRQLYLGTLQCTYMMELGLKYTTVEFMLVFSSCSWLYGSGNHN